MLAMRAVGMRVMQLRSEPEERARLVITTTLNFRQWGGWVTAMLTDRRLRGDESEAMYVADGSIAGSPYRQLAAGPLERQLHGRLIATSSGSPRPARAICLAALGAT